MEDSKNQAIRLFMLAHLEYNFPNGYEYPYAEMEEKVQKFAYDNEMSFEHCLFYGHYLEALKDYGGESDDLLAYFTMRASLEVFEQTT